MLRGKPKDDFVAMYFPDVVEYPNPTDELLPLGVLYQYISSTFLTGWINYVEIQLAYMINRYEEYDNNLATVKALDESKHVHTDLSTLVQDDVLILAKDESSRFWFFWVDRDSSDCCIGRFETQDTDERVCTLFEKYVKANNERGHDFELTKVLRGWISF